MGSKFLGQSKEHSDFPGGSVVKNSPTNSGDTGDAGSVPGLERPHRVGNGNLFPYSCLENPMDSVWWATIHRITESDMTEHTHTQGTFCTHSIF